ASYPNWGFVPELGLRTRTGASYPNWGFVPELGLRTRTGASYPNWGFVPELGLRTRTGASREGGASGLIDRNAQRLKRQHDCADSCTATSCGLLATSLHIAMPLCRPSRKEVCGAHLRGTTAVHAMATRH